MNLDRMVQIEPVGHCSVDDQCHSKSGARSVSAYMQYPLFCQLLDQLPELKELQLQGAEDPLLHLHFFQMVRYAVARGIRVSTHTGMTILSEERADECVQSGLHTMHVALDAASNRVYEAIHGKARFDKILRNLRRLMDAQSRHNSLLPHVHLSFTVMQKNLAELPDLVQLAHDEGIHNLSVQYLHREEFAGLWHPPLHAHDSENSLLQEDQQRIRFYFDLARSLAKKLKISLHLPGVPCAFAVKRFLQRQGRNPIRRFCHDGRSMPCSDDGFMPGARVQAGNVGFQHDIAAGLLHTSVSSGLSPEVSQRRSAESGTY